MNNHKKIKNLKKIDISKEINNVTGLPVNLGSIILDNFLNIIVDKSKKEKKIKLKNFGTFSINEKNERMGRNPINKLIYVIKKRRTITFKASSFLKKKINKNNINDIKNK